MTSAKSYRITDPELFKNKMLNWLKQFNIFCLLDNHHYRIHPHRYELMAAAGSKEQIRGGTDPFDQIDRIAGEGDWIFGHISYEQGAEWQGIRSHKEDLSGFPGFFFFIPRHVLVWKDDLLTIESPDPDLVYSGILDSDQHPGTAQPVILKHRISKDAYIKKIGQLKKHIQRGDCYEINFCQEFFAADAGIDPWFVYRELSQASPNPFSGFYRVEDSYLLCASPERFLYKAGNKVFCQPMKGTSRRSADRQTDDHSKEELRRSEKDRSENVMVVDLVRNDLSHFCEDGSVKVEELFGIYSFPLVHQMVSTVTGNLRSDVYFSHIIRSAFPMGSMTGAPKKRVVELINEFEPTARGIFSGTVGYIDPSCNFDFNVVIRSIMYNAATRYLSYQAGSGITFHSDAEKEWEECLLKGEAIKKVLTGSQHM